MDFGCYLSSAYFEHMPAYRPFSVINTKLVLLTTDLIVLYPKTFAGNPGVIVLNTNSIASNTSQLC